jgi:hypothetical protein
VDVGEEMIGRATHIPILMRIMDNSTGPVLELGTGHYSTTLLKWMCELQDRKLVSYEDSLRWYNKNLKNKAEFQDIIFTEDWNTVDIVKPWGVVFIDHARRYRAKHAALLANYAQYIICHDTQLDQNKRYQYSKIYSLFKYRYDYTKLIPYTTVLSNFNSLDWI